MWDCLVFQIVRTSPSTYTTASPESWDPAAQYSRLPSGFRDSCLPEILDMFETESVWRNTPCDYKYRLFSYHSIRTDNTPVFIQIYRYLFTFNWSSHISAQFSTIECTVNINRLSSICLVPVVEAMSQVRQTLGLVPKVLPRCLVIFLNFSVSLPMVIGIIVLIHFLWERTILFCSRQEQYRLSSTFHIPVSSRSTRSMWFFLYSVS